MPTDQETYSAAFIAALRQQRNDALDALADSAGRLAVEQARTEAAQGKAEPGNPAP